jgi:CheY-like chemotaxis protein
MSSRILLADDSTHAQRMGERILLEEGFEVVTVTDGQTALLRLADVDPDVILADAFLPRRSGLEICEFVKGEPRYRYIRVVLTAGMLEDFKDDAAREAKADGVLRKPFEASTMVKMMRGLVRDAEVARAMMKPEEMAVTPMPPAAPPLVAEGKADGLWSALLASAAPAAVPPPHQAAMAIMIADATAASTPPPAPGPVREAEPIPAAEARPDAVVEAISSEAAAVEPDPARVRAAVTLALDAAMPALIEELTERVLIALGH